MVVDDNGDLVDIRDDIGWRDIVSLTERVSKVEVSVTSLGDAVSSVERRVAALAERVSVLEVSVTRLKDAVESVEREVEKSHNSLRALTFTGVGAIIVQILLRLLGI